MGPDAHTAFVSYMFVVLLVTLRFVDYLGSQVVVAQFRVPEAEWPQTVPFISQLFLKYRGPSVSKGD